MVPAQLHAYESKKRKKLLRFESDTKQYEEKEKKRRAADSAKSCKFGEVKQPILQKKSLSSVAEQGCTPRRCPRVACMDKNLGKKTAEAGAEDPERKRPHAMMSPSPTRMTFFLPML
ncbi:hypothetical protein CFC21_083704 [Triticum aestivum]|uniref:TPX2 C-terminal domain-containing protein n=3 Tax=Triticum TaxID=4564 RepID=A0A9R1I975_WHEAT|nr:hypothetical protein CFC21_083703 [Triticum aestivum]KAF7079477.1 hypothetical protein CFC21_083704 [Triticum aestivum]VAI47178.1 unnamed protein product [Triticum turgidum subsp. durum]